MLDASIVGLYGSGAKSRTVTEKVFQICWKNHVTNVIREVDPKHIIVIGIGVDGILGNNIRRLNIPSTVTFQPQARLSSEQQLENYRKYQRICSIFC